MVLRASRLSCEFVGIQRACAAEDLECSGHLS